MGEPRIIAGRYEVREERRIGEREELRARDRTLVREVLLVRSRFDAFAGRAASERSLREARALAALRHGGIQRLFDVFEESEGPTLVLEPVPGETLSARLAREGKLTPEEVQRLACELAEALAAVHAAGAVHRDVSAENIVLRTDGSACLTGFRLAKPLGLGTGTTIEYLRAPEPGIDYSQELPAHPSPEQYAGESASARSDLFALGCVLYQAATGRPPFPPGTGWSAPTDPRKLAPGISRELASLVLACLARSPVGRPQSATELVRALQASQAPSPKVSRGLAPLLGGLVAVAVLTLGAWRLWPRTSGTGVERGIETPASAAAGASHTVGFSRSRALLIGIGAAYEGSGWNPLPNAVGDVEALADALGNREGDHWEVRTLLDEAATHDGIRTALEQLGRELGSEDRALIYFAGHGEPHPTSESSGWLIPSDARRDDTGKTRWLHFDNLGRTMVDTAAKHVLLALDCCYGGRAAELRGGGALAYQELFTTEPARVVLAAGRANQAVADGLGTHSPFASVLLASLAETERSFTTSELHGRLQREFLEQGLPQTPVLAHLPGVPAGEFVFLGR